MATKKVENIEQVDEDVVQETQDMVQDTQDVVERIHIRQLIDISKKYIKGEISPDELNEFGQTMVIRSYLPILDKMSIVMAILTEHMYSHVETQEVRVAELYRNMFFYGLLSGYAMIDCTEREYVTYENYDLLYPIFAPYILSWCKDDYEVFKDFIKDSINVYGLSNLVETMTEISPESMQQATKSNRDLIMNIENNKELINSLRDLADLNNPFVAQVAQELKKIGVESTPNTVDTSNNEAIKA